MQTLAHFAGILGSFVTIRALAKATLASICRNSRAGLPSGMCVPPGQVGASSALKGGATITYDALRQPHATWCGVLGFSTHFRTVLYDAGRMAGFCGFRERIAPHRKTVWTWMPLCAALLLPSLLFADVIYLKNGHKIVAQVTREDEKQVSYETDSGEFSVPKGLVDHVEKTQAPAAAPGQQT